MSRPDPGPLENFSMWVAFQPGAHHASVRNLKRLVNDWITMATQKTAGQRSDNRKGIPWVKGSNAVPWENLERIKMGILCEAVMLVLSGRLDTLEADEPDLEDDEDE